MADDVVRRTDQLLRGKPADLDKYVVREDDLAAAVSAGD
jgi:hypothetical protein